MEKSDLNPDPDPEILGIDPRDLPIPILRAIHWLELVTRPKVKNMTLFWSNYENISIMLCKKSNFKNFLHGYLVPSSVLFFNF